MNSDFFFLINIDYSHKQVEKKKIGEFFIFFIFFLGSLFET